MAAMMKVCVSASKGDTTLVMSILPIHLVHVVLGTFVRRATALVGTAKIVVVFDTILVVAEDVVCVVLVEEARRTVVEVASSQVCATRRVIEV
jgi:hypothetical protein